DCGLVNLLNALGVVRLQGSDPRHYWGHVLAGSDVCGSTT
ncbi:MAG: hypothetical protein ACI9PP_000915, partial [Halobacteriales archaeon]